MRANSLREVRTAAPTRARAVAYQVDEFVRTEAAAASGTLGHHMITAVSEEQKALFETEIAGPATVEVRNRITATEHDRLVARDQLATTPTGEIHAGIKATRSLTFDRAGLFRMNAGTGKALDGQMTGRGRPVIEVSKCARPRVAG